MEEEQCDELVDVIKESDILGILETYEDVEDDKFQQLREKAVNAVEKLVAHCKSGKPSEFDTEDEPDFVADKEEEVD